MAHTADPLLPKPLLVRVVSRSKKNMLLILGVAAAAMVLGIVMLSRRPSVKPTALIGGGYESGITAYWYPQWADNADMAKERIYGTGAPGMYVCSTCELLSVRALSFTKMRACVMACIR